MLSGAFALWWSALGTTWHTLDLLTAVLIWVWAVPVVGVAAWFSLERRQTPTERDAGRAESSSRSPEEGAVEARTVMAA